MLASTFEVPAQETVYAFAVIQFFNVDKSCGSTCRNFLFWSGREPDNE
jgi:hypothetical protein